MSTIAFFDLLGVADADVPEEAAADLWPLHLVQGTIGKRDELDLEEARFVVQELQAALTFRNVRPGSSPDRVGLTAEMLVGAVPPTLPIVLTALPDFAFHLLPTPSNPARVAVTAGDLGTELVIEALPVEIKLPIGFVTPLSPDPESPPPPEETQSDSFVAGNHDTITTILRTEQTSSIFVHIKARMTEDGRFVIEPAVPLSIGPCTFMGLPCRGIHDLNLFPSPRLGIGPDDEAHFGDQALEWTRHPLLDDNSSDFGVVTVRTVDLEDTRKPLSFIRDAINPEHEHERNFEWVVEDLAFPIGRIVPLPSHFLVGLRRELGPQDDPNGAYNLGGLAIPLKGAARILRAEYLLVEQLLFRSVPDADLNAPSGDRQMAFVKLALVDDPSGEGHGATLELTDDWTVLAGWRHQPGVSLFKLFTADFSLLGARVGLSIQRLADGKSVFDSGVLLGDIKIELAGSSESPDSEPGAVKLKSDGKEAKGVVVNDFGLRFGDFQIGSFWRTGGASLKAFDIVELKIEEFGLVTELSGAVYFGFSGSIPLPAGRDAKEVKTGGAKDEGSRMDGVGFRFYRLRGKIAGPEEAPFLLIDGIGISLRYGKVGIKGFGTLTEIVRDGHRYKEAGLGIELQVDFDQQAFKLGGLFFYGKVTGPVHRFSYGMAGLSVSPIPISSGLLLIDVRLLFAWNMAPRLGPVPAGSASAMRLYQWYEENRSAVALPDNRNLGLTGWSPADDAWTIAVGAGMSVSKSVTLDAFLVYMSTTAGNGLLAGMKIFLFRSGNKSNKPIGFAVFEIEGERWSVSAGLSIGTANVIGKKVPFLEEAALLTGTFYHTNKPATTAIGQFKDPSTWLSIHIGAGKGKKLDLFTVELYAGLCIQIVDLPEGPRVFASRLSITGGSRLFKVGGIDFYLTVQVTVGVWRTESRVSGFVVFFEGGLNIDVFYVFNFGASARVQLDYLGPDPVFRRFAFEVRIDTPWWLPDTSFRWNRQSGEAAPEQMATLTTPLVDASAIQLSAPQPVELNALSPVVGASIQHDAVYSINDLAAASGSVPANAIAEIVPISVDSSLSLHFNASIDDRLVFGQNTVPGVGSDKSGDVSTVYELVELGIWRKPRAAASGWTFLIAPATSRMESLEGLPPDIVEERMRQKVRLRWDADFQREGKPDPRRLLINTDTPFLLVALNLEADEALLRNVPGWPCCPPEKSEPVWHTLDFKGVMSGTRVPPVQYFSESRSTLHWSGIAPPIAGPGHAAAGESRVARLNVDTTPQGVFARLTLDKAARVVELAARWRPLHLNRTLVARAFRRFDVVEERHFDVDQSPPNKIVFDVPDGITEVLLSMEGAPLALPDDSFGWIEWVGMRYRSVREVETDALYDGRCKSNEDDAAKPGGRFAWLPNHDYEISLKTRVTVQHEGSGALVREVPQTLRFQTKGLPGLNWSERHGSEFEPYVDAEYPRPSRVLYRNEPVMLALNEKSDIFRIPDPPRPDDPAERRQQTDWALVVHRVGGAGPPERVSRPGEDWIVANRGTAPAPGPVRHPIDVALAASVVGRSASSLDPLWQRFEIVRASPFGCNEPPSEPPSRVLAHKPYDPDADSAADTWPARAVLRAAVQIRGTAVSGANPFVERAPFDSGDETAMATTTPGLWAVEAGAIGPASDTGSTSSLALFGEANWHNVHIGALVDPEDGEAGIAVAVRGTPEGSDALLFTVHGTARQLRALRRQGGTQTLLESVVLPDTLSPPYTIDVTTYDDVWEASAGEATLKLERNPLDKGRLALAVLGTGRIHELRVEPLDLYHFDFQASRFVDFAGHIGSWKGTLDLLPEAVPATSDLADLIAGTPLSVLMTRGSDRDARQREFDRWCASLGVLLRSSMERLEISRSGVEGAIDYLLMESPEPIPFTEDVTVSMLRVDGVPAGVPLAILSDGAERRAFLVPVDALGSPTAMEPGTYEITWKLDRLRYRAAATDADHRLIQEVTMTIAVE